MTLKRTARTSQDHMYMSRDTQGGGFIGFAVSTPTVPGFGSTWLAAGLRVFACAGGH